MELVVPRFADLDVPLIWNAQADWRFGGDLASDAPSRCQRTGQVAERLRYSRHPSNEGGRRVPEQISCDVTAGSAPYRNESQRRHEAFGRESVHGVMLRFVELERSVRFAQ
jgi:hypothetical protein